MKIIKEEFENNHLLYRILRGRTNILGEVNPMGGGTFFSPNVKDMKYMGWLIFRIEQDYEKYTQKKKDGSIVKGKKMDITFYPDGTIRTHVWTKS